MKPSYAILGAILLALLAVAACEHAEHPQVDTRDLSLRDVLGLDPELQRDLDEDQRDDLRHRLLTEAETDWLEPWTDPASTAHPVQGLPAPFDVHPDDPFNVMRRLDGWRQTHDQDAWLLSVYLHTDDGAQTFGCPLEPDAELKPHSTDQLPDTWQLVDDFGSADPQELRQLRSLAAGLDAWRTRCLDDRDIPPDVHPRLRIVRQPNAPYLLAFWPQRYSLYIHPLLLQLWGSDEAADPSSEDLRTQTLPSHYSSYDSCVATTNQLCTLCTREYTAAHPAECQRIFPNTAIYEDCDALRFSIPDGVIRYCADHFLKQPSILSCFQSGASAELCKLPPETVAVGSSGTLGMYYGGFSDASTRQLCRTTLETCTLPPDSDGDGIPDNLDQCNSTPSGAAVDADPRGANSDGTPTNPRYGCAPDECRDAENPGCQDQKDRERKLQEVDNETTCETDCWNVTLNGSGINDCCGSLVGFDLVYYDYKRPEMLDTLCEESQPTTCCGDAPEPPSPANP